MTLRWSRLPAAVLIVGQLVVVLVYVAAGLTGRGWFGAGLAAVVLAWLAVSAVWSRPAVTVAGDRLYLAGARDPAGIPLADILEVDARMTALHVTHRTPTGSGLTAATTYLYQIVWPGPLKRLLPEAVVVTNPLGWPSWRVSRARRARRAAADGASRDI